MDYTCERGAKRNFEPWRANGESNKIETEEETLDRLEAEEAVQGGAMEQLEAKVVDAKREMDIADALDEIRTRNARIQRAEGKGEVDAALELAQEERRRRREEERRLEDIDAEAARRAFAKRNEEITDLGSEKEGSNRESGSQGLESDQRAPTRVPIFKKTVRKKEVGGILGSKLKPALV